MKTASAYEAWNAAMRRGDFVRAWRETDRLEALRSERTPAKGHLLWNGRNPHGRNVLVRCLHGLGDTIQFSRFLPRLNGLAFQLFVFVQPALLALLASQRGFGVVSDDRTNRRIPQDLVELEIMELAYLFRATPETLPLPNLHIPEVACAKSDIPPTTAKRIAIFWGASGWGGGRHVPFALFESLADLPNVQFFSFQQGDCEREAGYSEFPIRRLSKHTVEICDLAGALAQMDLVLSVDAMPAHLAASLRVPVWLLLERVANWRWIEGRADSPWYPEMRIFRESRGWEEIIGKIQRDLKNYLGSDTDA